MLSVAACVAVRQPVRDEAASEAPLRFLNQGPEVKYVGRDQCKLCHLGIFETFAGTGMGRSFYPLTAETAVEDFTGNNQLVVQTKGVHYRMYERGGRYYQRQYLLDSRGREFAVDERQLVYVIGSNNHGRGYVTLQGDGMFQAPVCWDPTETMWMLCPGFEYDNSHFSREIGYTCFFCHNGRMELVQGERNRYREPIPHGIGCERCHGPGQLHVERYLGGGGTPKRRADLAIVNPRRLPPEERIQVCFQCHLGDSSATERVVRHGRTLDSFRPGQPLSQVVVPFRYAEPTEFDFGIAAQADRLILSRCYTESGGRLECLTCQDPHVTVYRKDRPSDFFREKCLGCHRPDDCAAPQQERGRTEPVDDCVSCHLRRAEPVDRRYARFTDHWIRRDVELTERDRRTTYELEPVFPEAFASLSAGEQAYQRARANFLRALEAPAEARPLLWGRAERSFRQALENGFDVAETWFFLGKVHMYEQQWTEAVDALETALKRDADHHDAAFALGQSLAALGEFARASAVFREMLTHNPDDPMALAEYGRASWTLGCSYEAISAFRRAVEQEPWNAPLRLNLGRALASAGRFEEAAEVGAQAARLDPDAIPVWEFYQNVMRYAGRPDQAKEGSLQLQRLRERR